MKKTRRILKVLVLTCGICAVIIFVVPIKIEKIPIQCEIPPCGDSTRIVTIAKLYQDSKYDIERYDRNFKARELIQIQKGN